MTQITLTLGQSERVKEVFPGVYVFNVTAANAICKVAQEYVDSYYDKSMVEDLSENDEFKLSKMYPRPETVRKSSGKTVIGYQSHRKSCEQTGEQKW